MRSPQSLPITSIRRQRRFPGVTSKFGSEQVQIPFVVSLDAQLVRLLPIPSVWPFFCLRAIPEGDFGAMFYMLQNMPEINMMTMMAVAMASGITTSVALETVVLRLQERMTWKTSLTTAINMSFLSMLTMEFAENVVDLYLTKGAMNYSDPMFWAALAPALAAGFLAPLPYNYWRLKKHNQSCH